MRASAWGQQQWKHSICCAHQTGKGQSRPCKSPSQAWPEEGQTSWSNCQEMDRWLMINALAQQLWSWLPGYCSVLQQLGCKWIALKTSTLPLQQTAKASGIQKLVCSLHRLFLCAQHGFFRPAEAFSCTNCPQLRLLVCKMAAYRPDTASCRLAWKVLSRSNIVSP